MNVMNVLYNTLVSHVNYHVPFFCYMFFLT